MNPQYPVFVPTKNRYKAPLTIKELERLEVPYTAVVEEQEYAQYKEVVKKGSILVLPHHDQGLMITRNWIWDYAQHELKVPYYWTIDDNIRHFYELNQNMKWYTTSGTFFRVMEDFVGRYENVMVAGMHYEMFTPRKQKHPPFIPNTRVYSNMLIKADAPYRNQLFYNDDTDLCLRILKDGNCTVLFNIFVAEKMQTMRVKGGMTDYYEKTNKRREFAEMLQRAHPEVVKVVWKYNRWHHEVDYRPFRNNPFKLKEGVVIANEPNEYGMKRIVTTPLVLVTKKPKVEKPETVSKGGKADRDATFMCIDKPKSVAHGLRFILRPGTSDRQVVKEVIEQNSYRRRDFQIEQGEHWLDLGANIGAFSLLAVRCGATVDAYEPEPDNLLMLESNLFGNEAHAQVKVCQFAVVDDAEKATHLKLYLSTEYGKWGHSLYKPKRKTFVEVPTVHISDILSGVDGIKMDIEGAEIAILPTIADFKDVKKLVFEWHFDMSPSVPFFLNTIEHLRQFFPHIIHRKFKDGADTLKVFPSGAIVFCWK